MTEPADGQLLGAFYDRLDQQAFAALMERHLPMVLRACQRVLGQAEEAEDAAQDTFLILVRKGDRLRGQKSLIPWLRHVAIQVALNRRIALRCRKDREKKSAAREEERRWRAQALAARKADLALDLDELPGPLRQLLYMAHFGGFRFKDMASHFGCSPAALAMWRKRALAQWNAQGLERGRTQERRGARKDASAAQEQNS